MKGSQKRGSGVWSAPILTPAALPAMGRAGQLVPIENDGDGNPAVYAWNAITEAWVKMSDPDSSGLSIPVSVINGGTGGTSQATARSGIDAEQIGVAAAAVAVLEATLGGAALLDVGVGPGTVAAGDDARLSDARTPTGHAATHATGQPDAVSPADIGALALAGGTMTGPVDMGGQAITNLPTPSVDSGAATRGYVISLINGLDWQESVISETAAVPGAPIDGDRYIVGAGAAGLWAGQDEKITEWDGAAWQFITPNKGYTVHNEATGSDRLYNGAAWVDIGTSVDHNSLLNLGTGDPHAQYQEEDEKGAAGGYAPLDGAQLLPLANLPGHGSQHRVGGADAATVAVVDPASPYTVAAGVRLVLASASTIVVLPDSGINVGEVVEVVNTSASAVTVTLRRAGADTIDGAAADVPITVGARGRCGAARRAAADYQSVQPPASSVSSQTTVTAAGSGSITIPTTAVRATIELVAGGGGGGGGRKGATSSNRGGGGAGAGGGYARVELDAAALRAIAATLDYTVGSGGAGGAGGDADSTDGADGTAGGDTFVSVGATEVARSYGGPGGVKGTTASTSNGGTGNVNSQDPGGNGGRAQSSNQSLAGDARTRAAGGGGGGGTVGSSNAAGDGKDGGAGAFYQGNANRAGVGSAGVALGDAAAATSATTSAVLAFGGSGGGGGGGALVGAASHGGNGVRGGGGGGGGGATNATGTTGNGGNGGAGWLRATFD